MMYINYITHYIPDTVISNLFFEENYGISDNDIFSKSGIRQRRKTKDNENTNSMAIEAVKNAFFYLPYPITDIDLIIGATYTPYDTVGTLSHTIQRQFNIHKAKCFTVDSACSSFVNAVEIVDCFFYKNKAKNALIIVSENNTVYNDFSDNN